MIIQYNKSFLDNIIKIFDAYFIPTHRKTEANVKVFTEANASIVETQTTNTNSKYCHFVTESTLTAFNKISNTYDGLSAANKNTVKILVNTILNGNLFQRNSAFDKLVQMNILLAGDISKAKALMATLINYNPDIPFRSFVSEVEAGSSDINFFRYQYTVPLQLERKYLQENNIPDETGKREKLYLLFVARGQDSFGFSPATVSSVNEKYGYFVKNWDESTQTYKTGLSYIAVDMGDIQADADATIKYDHIDKIEYLDNYIIQMFIPNKFND